MITDMKYTPESGGVSSAALLKLLKKADRKKIPLHSLLIAKGDDILLNAYWKPFSKEAPHRMNSVTKSFVSLAVGSLVAEGRLMLTDRVIDYFPECSEFDLSEEFSKETVYDLLTMRTPYVLVPGKHWVKFKLYDRIRNYFESKPFKPKQTLFYYDSPASYILCVIIERLTGTSFLDYLKARVLDKIGFSRSSDCIKDAAGYSWGDSGLLCTTEDLYRVGRLITCGGKWDGEQLMDKGYLEAAISSHGSSCDNGNDENHGSYGYGYQIWRERYEGFGFHGMGMQYMISIPEKDLIICCTADTQGNDPARAIFIDMLFDFIDEEVLDGALPEDPIAYGKLLEYIDGLKLVSIGGSPTSDIAGSIGNKRVILNENPMGLKWIKLDFEKGEFIYENQQGEKRLGFGVLENVFTEFPQDGYDNMKIGESPFGYRHPCAVSAAWLDGSTFGIKVQAIGNHLGGLFIRIGFDGTRVGLHMQKTTECFFNEYSGYAIGRIED